MLKYFIVLALSATSVLADKEAQIRAAFERSGIFNNSLFGLTYREANLLEGKYFKSLGPIKDFGRAFSPKIKRVRRMLNTRSNDVINLTLVDGVVAGETWSYTNKGHEVDGRLYKGSDACLYGARLRKKDLEFRFRDVKHFAGIDPVEVKDNGQVISYRFGYNFTGIGSSHVTAMYFRPLYNKPQECRILWNIWYHKYPMTHYLLD